MSELEETSKRIYQMRPVSPLDYASNPHLTERHPTYEDYYEFAVWMLETLIYIHRLIGKNPPPGWEMEWWLKNE